MKHLLLHVALMGFVAACGGKDAAPVVPTEAGADTNRSTDAIPDGNPPATEASPERAVAPVESPCEAPQVIQDEGALATILQALPWEMVWLGKSGVLGLSRDYEAGRDLAITKEMVKGLIVDPREGGSTVFGVRENAYPEARYGAHPIEGVSCAVSLERAGSDLELCTDLRIRAGTRFRLIGTEIVDMAQAAYVIGVERPCAASCAADERRCVATHRCLPTDAGLYCAWCEARGVAECACREGDTVKPDGTKCDYDVSPDLGGSGTCQRGVCQ